MHKNGSSTRRRKISSSGRGKRRRRGEKGNKARKTEKPRKAAKKRRESEKEITSLIKTSRSLVLIVFFIRK